MSLPNRRRFLAVTLGAGGALAWGAFGSRESKRSDRRTGAEEAPASLSHYTRTSRALGSAVSMTAWSEDRRSAERAVAAAFDELELVEEVMSVYRPESQLSRLNRFGRLENPHRYLFRVLDYSQLLSRRTEGAFDVTVQPLWSLYAEAAKRGRAPEMDEIRAAQSRVDYRRLSVSRSELRLKDRAQVTLNGVAQGFAADCAAAALRRGGVRHALIDTGEIGTLGAKPDGQAWTVGVQHPRQADAYISLAEMDGRCLATSGDYATRFSEDKCDHHLFDPRTGRSPVDFASVSVAGRTAMEADGLSTAAFVLGLEGALRLIRETSGADALFVTKSGAVLATNGFPAKT